MALILVLLALVAASLAGCGGSSSPSDEAQIHSVPIRRQNSIRNDDRAPVALLIHGGAFVMEVGPHPMRLAAKSAKRAGFRPMDVAYPNGDPMAAWRRVRNVARRLKKTGRDVVAYGESVGGTLAALLAEKGLSDFTVANSPVSNLNNWHPVPGYWKKPHTGKPETGSATFNFLSPKLHRSERPVLVLASKTDKIVPYGMNRSWRNDPKVHVRDIKGGHIGYVDYEQNLGLAFKWLRKVETRKVRRGG